MTWLWRAENENEDALNPDYVTLTHLAFAFEVSLTTGMPSVKLGLIQVM